MTKMTKAMQMIASVKMRQAVSASLQAAPFAEETATFLMRFAKYLGKNSAQHIYLTDNKETLKNVLGVVIASNRGLCGNFHSQIEKKIHQVIKQPEALLNYPFDEVDSIEKDKEVDVNFEWIVVGRKGEQIVRRLNQPIVASFSHLSDKVDQAELDAVYKIVKDSFDSLKYQKVVIFYTHYINSFKQVPIIRQILPINQEEIERLIKDWGLNYHPEAEDEKADYLIEPNQSALIEVMSLLLLKSIIYYAVLQSKASVESARMMAMKNATDAATEMGQVLNLVYNQLRQSKITGEIAEISAGRAALE
jgi:F-type H+-transporting ATPase subunit gamma